MTKKSEAQPQGDDILLIGEAAQILDLSGERVRQLARDGYITAIRSGRRGVHLFRRSDVLTLKRERAGRK